MITLKTLEFATAQEVYNQVKEHLLKQNRQSRNDKHRLYRGHNNTTCAAGCLIADDEYNKDKMENKSWRMLVDAGIVPPHHSDLIKSLQRIHDIYAPCYWLVQLKACAVIFKLTP